MQEEQDWWKNNILFYASAIKILDRLISSSFCMPLYASMCISVVITSVGWH